MRSNCCCDSHSTTRRVSKEMKGSISSTARTRACSPPLLLLLWDVAGWSDGVIVTVGQNDTKHVCLKKKNSVLVWTAPLSLSDTHWGCFSLGLVHFHVSIFLTSRYRRPQTADCTSSHTAGSLCNTWDISRCFCAVKAGWFFTGSRNISTRTEGIF